MAKNQELGKFADFVTVNTASNSAAISGNLSLNVYRVSANGGYGSNGQALTTNGTSVYWSTIVGTNTDAQYVWTNTHVFGSNGFNNTTVKIYSNNLPALTAHSNDSAAAYLSSNSGGYVASLISNGSSSGLSVTTNTGSGIYITTKGAYLIDARYYTNPRFTIIANTGYVGINNASPTDVLSVNGNTYLGGNLNISGSIVSDVTITGNLTVSGTTTTINTATLDVKDLNITVAKGSANGSVANGAGLTVDGASATWVWDNSLTSWVSNVNITVGNTTQKSTINTTATFSPFGHMNSDYMDYDFTTTANINTVIGGPFTIANGYTLTISAGSRVAIV